MSKRNVFFVIFLTTLQSIILHSSNAFAKDPEQDLMLTVGDSISAGFMASTSAVPNTSSPNLDAEVSDPLLFPIAPNLVSPFPRHNIPKWKFIIAQIFNHKEDLSWSSGDQIDSHFQYLKNYLAAHEPNTTLTAANVASSGAQTADLPGEAEAILDIWNTHRYDKIRYMTFMIGNNDACIDWVSGGVPDNDITTSIKQFFSTISVIKQSEPIHVLVSALPKIPDLAFPEIFNYPVAANKSCRAEAMNTVKYCNPLLDWTTPTEYANRVDIIARKNAAIKKAISEIAEQYPQFDFSFSDSLFSYKPNINLIANDCFHPNELGQSAISKLLWTDQPWFK